MTDYPRFQDRSSQTYFDDVSDGGKIIYAKEFIPGNGKIRKGKSVQTKKIKKGEFLKRLSRREPLIYSEVPWKLVRVDIPERDDKDMTWKQVIKNFEVRKCSCKQKAEQKALQTGDPKNKLVAEEGIQAMKTGSEIENITKIDPLISA